MMFRQLIVTPVGPLQASWTGHGLWAFEFQRSEFQNMGNPNHGSGGADARESAFDGRLTESLEQCVQDYFETGRFDWDLSLLDWTGVSKFTRRVLEECYDIAAGETLTYGALAARAGSPNAARAVGRVMARNRWPILIPCHRVVGAAGGLTGYSGVGGLETKRKLLDLEFALHPVQSV